MTEIFDRFTADLEWLAAGAGPHAAGWPDALHQRGDAGELWWPVWWCPGGVVDAHLSAASSRQAEAAPARTSTVQREPPAPGVWIAHAAGAADATEEVAVMVWTVAV